MSSKEDELVDLQKRFSLLQGDLKAYVEAAMWTQSHNSETIKALRAENKKLRDDLGRVRNLEDNYSMTQSLKEEVKRADKAQAALRKRHDLKHAEADRMDSRLESLKDRLEVMSREAARALNHDSSESQAIRRLENRLDKAMIKYNEAMSIRKTYEQIKQRLEEERLGFDNQLAAIERTLETKEQDLGELIMMQRDAVHARDVAKSELERFESMIEAERAAKEREKQDKVELVNAKEEKMAALERRQRQIELEAASSDSESENADQAAADARLLEEQERKIATYEDAFRQIKEATGVADVNEVIKKFLTQEATHKSLEASKKQAEARLDELRHEKTKLASLYEELRFAGTGDRGTAESVAEFEANLAESTAKMERNRTKFNLIADALLEAKSGVGHLADMLAEYKFPTIAKTPPMADDTVVETLAIAEAKVLKLLDAVEDGDMVMDADDDIRALETKLASRQEAQLPPDNLRVAIALDDESDLSEASDDADARDDVMDDEFVPTRESMRRMADRHFMEAQRRQRRQRRR
ncbi:uncharacterized protein AMSG_04118 [Thecamonas trahens ATCC 50062]|uniref:ODAD1 central coiled coil region domain-containing protein n=1 Tax=Thecamonas trahens ATCC 50062 TaxID=461836 RepID=A0A0L0D672_THETB|nr:hypothetical protein AMSG_04118 [Thecamonas trahens ATCC 50062]KNC47887.1 hypothetical protein AMSG_04118 [Thecamonas trahens ATCC 50062]|eukprot:XP_013758909.1 hypothetical protein AMSG_04118 [Thecamonas trahens ATCC 50062]